MVEIKLCKCCMECNHADLEIETDSFESFDIELKHVTVTCTHEHVCYQMMEYKKQKN